MSRRCSELQKDKVEAQKAEDHPKKVSGPPTVPVKHHHRAAVISGDDGDDKKDSPVCGRERLKMHRVDVAGRVWIPDIWGQEELLNEWIDCSAFDRSLFPTGISSAREALAEEGRRASSGGLPVGNPC